MAAHTTPVTLTTRTVALRDIPAQERQRMLAAQERLRMHVCGVILDAIRKEAAEK